MRKRISMIILAMFSFTIVVTGCSVEDYAVDPTEPQVQDQALIGGGETAASQANTGTPAPGASDSAIPSDDDEGRPEDAQVIDSEGVMLPLVQNQGQSGAESSVGVGDVTEVMPAEERIVGDRPLSESYINDAYGFSLNYPQGWAYFTPPARIEGSELEPLREVWFQEADMVEAGTADIEPPKLVIAVYDNPTGLSVQQWTQYHRFIQPDDDVAQVTLGARDGLQVCARGLIAPRCTVFLQGGDHIFALTALTAEAELALGTLSFAR